MAVYEIRQYPKTVSLRGEAEVELRPMVKTDAAALLEFFRRVPEDERFFLKHEVAWPEVVQGFAEGLDYDRALPLLALFEGRIVGDAVLIRHRGGYRQHMASLRVTIDPELREKGLGVKLMTELLDIAWDAELDYCDLELVEDVQDDAIAAAKYVGASPAGRIEGAAKDIRGVAHDLVILRVQLGTGVAMGPDVLN